jgi:hypothetical protein
MQSKLLTLIVLGSAVSSMLVSAQLVGCDAVDCPTGANHLPACTLSNTTYTQIGITNFTTSLSPAPLTWTLAIVTKPDPDQSSNLIVSRDLFLGAPPSLDLNNETSTQGCALSFDGIAANLRFAGDSASSAITVGTCGDAMGSQCATDLRSQAEAKLTDLLNTSTNSSDLCASLADALQGNAPSTCNAVHNGSWGTINAKGDLPSPERCQVYSFTDQDTAITGASAPSPIQLGECHATTGQGYTMSQVDSYNSSIVATSTDLLNFVNGITPVITFFAKEGATADPETHLSCLKMISATQNLPNEVMPGGAMEMVPGRLMPVFVSAVCALWFFLM